MIVGSQLVVSERELFPLAVVLAEELWALTGRRFLIREGEAVDGDVRLSIDETLKDEEYSLEIGKTAEVRGVDYCALASGTVSILQVISSQQSLLKLPRMKLLDAPFASYRGLLIDLARNWHSLESLKQIVVMCRWYKIHYLQLHLTDDQSSVFRSRSYPHSGAFSRHYTTNQLCDLQAFATTRGVTIVPELNTPGHSAALRQSIPQLRCEPMGDAMCCGKETTYKIIDTLICELCEIFQTTKYFHIGCDEVIVDGWRKCTACRSYMQTHNLTEPSELYRHFITRLNTIVKRYGKQTIVWEGFHKRGKISIPRDIIVMVFECLYNTPFDLVKDGYSVINASSIPLYVVNDDKCSAEHIYRWNLYRWEPLNRASSLHGRIVELAPTKMVLGAQICAWEQAEMREIPSLRKRLPMMSERVWNPFANLDFNDFSTRLNKTDAQLTRILAAAELN